MVFFVIFVFAAVILGVGTMLAPALPTEQPRVGLASAIALAFVMSGGILWTRFIGWDTLVIDYLLFGIVSLVVLGGTMVQAHQKATGESDEIEQEIEWMTRNELIFFVIIGILCLGLLILPEHASSDITQAIRDGEALSSIDNMYPEIQTFGAIGFHVLSAYLSQQLQQDIGIVHLAVGSVLAFLTILTAYDLGAEIKNTRIGQFAAMGMLIVITIAYFAFESIASSLMAVLFVLAFLICTLRTVKYRQWQDIAGIGILLITIISFI